VNTPNTRRLAAAAIAGGMAFLRTLSVTAIGLLAALLAAAPAQAALQWHSGTSESSVVLNCNFAQEPGIQANAEFQSDPQAIPGVGDVFYVRSVIARIGDGCGIDMLGHVEIVPPPGVTAAISGQNPVRCQWLDIATGALSPAGGCPQEVQEAVYGPGFDQLTPGGATPTYPWRIAYQQALVIEIPLRSNRGLQGTSPTCGRLEGDPPCTLPSQSGDTLQFTVRMLDAWSSAWLSPYVPLFVNGAGGPGAKTPKAGGGGAGTAGLLARAPRSLKLRQLLRGLPVTVNVATAGSTVTAQLTAGGLRASRSASIAKVTVIARATRRLAKAGTLRLRLKPTRKAARALRRTKRPLKLRLKVRVTPPAGRAQTATTRITVKR
jgi:hypothetical protein